MAHSSATTKLAALLAQTRTNSKTATPTAEDLATAVEFYNRVLTVEDVKDLPHAHTVMRSELYAVGEKMCEQEKPDDGFFLDQAYNDGLRVGVEICVNRRREIKSEIGRAHV